MKYVGVCRIKQGKRTEYELSQAEIEDIKQYIPQALREGAASGVCEGSGAVSAVLVLQTIAENLGSMLTPYTAVSLGMLGSCLAVAGREEKDAGKGEKRRGTGGHGQRSSRIFRGLQCADCGDESGSASCAGFVGYPLLKKDFRCYT